MVIPGNKGSAVDLVLEHYEYMVRDRADAARAELAQSRQHTELMKTALRELLEVVEASEMSCRDMDPHKYEAIREDAEKRARAALARKENL